ncbi:MAG TPA: CHASE3 domain-containing protein [Chryseolinea sp.]|nr:CHASE3 domain-containing protein [Chryseolinea sp.]
MKTNRVANLLVASILLALVSAVAKYINVSEKKQYMGLIYRAYEIIRRSTELEYLLTDAENCERAYLLKRDSSDLLTYRNEVAIVRHTYDTLLQLVSDNASEATLLKTHIKPHIDRFTRLTDLLIAESSASITTQGFHLRDDTTRNELKSLKAELQGLVNEEDALLKARAASLKRITTINDIFHYSSFVMICIISGLALKTLLDKEKRNQELLSSLHEANKNLEDNVQERTIELERKSNLAEKLNRDLQDNFEELQSFYETLHSTNKHAEDTLREMRDLYENAPTGYHSLDSSGLIVRMNQTELNWLGYTRDEVVGKMHITNILAAEEHADYRENFASFLRQGYVRNLRHTFIRRDGTRLKILLNATAIYDQRGKYLMSRGVSYLMSDESGTTATNS